jgi:hypothetical protein
MSETRLWSLEALRGQGAERFDPVRFRYLEVLSDRVDGACGEVRRILEVKLTQALADLGERFTAQAQARASQADVASPPAVRAPLAQLNQYIQQVTQDGGHPGPGRDGAGRAPGIKSADRFRETWSKIAAEKQVDHALGRGPENAGPLNAHMLVLHSLALMRKLSPDYLRRFLAQADALLWLDQVNEKYTLAEAKSARPPRSGQRPSAAARSGPTRGG